MSLSAPALPPPATPRGRAVVRGLTNSGNTCFFNATLQCLASSAAWARVFASEPAVEPEPALAAAMRDTMHALWAPMPAIPQVNAAAGRAVNPSHLLSAVVAKAPRFKGHRQQDAQELLRYLLNALQDDEVARLKKRDAGCGDDAAAGGRAAPQEAGAPAPDAATASVAAVVDVECSAVHDADAASACLEPCVSQNDDGAQQAQESHAQAVPEHGSDTGAMCSNALLTDTHMDERFSELPCDTARGAPSTDATEHTPCVAAATPPPLPADYISRIFGGRLLSLVVCAECDHVSPAYDAFLDVSLELPAKLDKSKPLTATRPRVAVSAVTVAGHGKRSAVQQETKPWKKGGVAPPTLPQAASSKKGVSKEARRAAEVEAELAALTASLRVSGVAVAGTSIPRVADKWLDTASKADLVKWLQAHAPASVLSKLSVQRSIAPEKCNHVTRKALAAAIADIQKKLPTSARVETAHEAAATSVVSVVPTPSPVAAAETRDEPAQPPAADATSEASDAAAPAQVEEGSTSNGNSSEADAGSNVLPTLPVSSARAQGEHGDAPFSSEQAAAAAPRAECNAAAVGVESQSVGIDNTGGAMHEGEQPVASQAHAAGAPPPAVSAAPPDATCVSARAEPEAVDGAVAAPSDAPAPECTTPNQAHLYSGGTIAGFHVPPVAAHALASGEQARVSLSSCFAAFTNVEMLSAAAGNGYRCARCRDALGVGSTNAYKRLLLLPSSKGLPPVLCIHLKRFAAVGRSHFTKLTGHVGFEEFMDFTPFVAASAGADAEATPDASVTAATVSARPRYMYRLIGVVVHSGGMVSGHYIAYVRWDAQGTADGTSAAASDSQWAHVSDTIVTPVDLHTVLNCEAYMLFYERVRAR